MQTSAVEKEESFVLVERKKDVAILTLNRPQKRNTLSRPMLLELQKHLKAFQEDKEVRAIILAAKGPVFSSGHDLKELVGTSESDAVDLFNLCTDVMELIRQIPQPVIAQVHGLASAAGCQLVASCDLAVASREASFQTPGVKIGLFCSTPAVPLARSIPLKKAMEMLLTGEPINAEEAERQGLVNRVVPSESLAEEALAFARKIIAHSRETIGLGKEAFYRQLPLGRKEAYDVAKQTMVKNTFSEDAQEGMNAFLQKRSPSWKK